MPSLKVRSPRHRRERRGAALARRAGWNVGDQILSALTNVALAFIVARAVDARGFGAFSIAFLIFSLLVGVERALVGQPMSMVYSAAEPHTLARAIRGGTGTALALGAVSGVGAVITGTLVGGVTGHALIAVGVVLPGLMLQDACRMIFFALRKPALATLNDTIWAVFQFVPMIWMVAAGVRSVTAYVLVWGASAAIAATVGLIQLGHLPSISLVRWWVKHHRTLSGYLMAEYVLGAGAYQSCVFLIGAFVGVQAVGSLRAAAVLIGPVGILATAIFTFALPELTRRGTLPSAVRAKIALAVSGLLVIVTAGYGALLLLFPDRLGGRFSAIPGPGPGAFFFRLLLVPWHSARVWGRFSSLIRWVMLGLHSACILWRHRSC